MNEKCELSYCELRAKEVVNSTDGKRMGRIIDIVFASDTGIVLGIIVPFARRALFNKGQDVFIPWKCVVKIGEDVILVNVTLDNCGQMNCKRPSSACPACPAPPPPPCGNPCGCPKEECKNEYPNCDRRCDKCMLFDCAYRWRENE